MHNTHLHMHTHTHTHTHNTLSNASIVVTHTHMHTHTHTQTNTHTHTHTHTHTQTEYPHCHTDALRNHNYIFCSVSRCNMCFSFPDVVSHWLTNTHHTHTYISMHSIYIYTHAMLLYRCLYKTSLHSLSCYVPSKAIQTIPLSQPWTTLDRISLFAHKHGASVSPNPTSLGNVSTRRCNLTLACNPSKSNQVQIPNLASADKLESRFLDRVCINRQRHVKNTISVLHSVTQALHLCWRCLYIPYWSAFPAN